MIPEKESIVKPVQNICVSESPRGNQVVALAKSFVPCRRTLNGVGSFLSMSSRDRSEEYFQPSPCRIVWPASSDPAL